MKTSYILLFNKFDELEKVFFVAKDVTCHQLDMHSSDENDVSVIIETQMMLIESMKYLNELKTAHELKMVLNIKCNT